MTPALTPAQKAATLLELHHASQPLILINVWDAASAAMVEHCGLPAVATSSAAMANALGFPDGQYLPWAQMLEAVARVCRAVKVPVTADIESGFASNVTALETSITQIIAAGAVGVNLEDVMPARADLNDDDLKDDALKDDDLPDASSKNADAKNADPRNADPKNAGPKNADAKNADAKNADAKNADAKKAGAKNADAKNPEDKNSEEKNPEEKNANSKQSKSNVRHGNPLFPLPTQIARIQAARRAAHAAGIHLVINARTDAYWQAGVNPAEAMRNTLERGKAYLQAGADCIFIPGLRNPDHIKTVIDHLRSVYQQNVYQRDDSPRSDHPRSAREDSGHPRSANQAPDNLRADHREPAINILAGPGVPSIPDLAKLGVKRVSYGSGPHRAAMGLLRRMASEAKTSGTFQALTEGAVPYEEINGLMGR